jgi:acyl-coenzyme A synthetase/AMP-(fatty) acid ligase
MLCEERVLADCSDVLECTVVAVPTQGKVVTSVLLMLDAEADQEADRTAEVLAALDPRVARTVERVVVVSADRIPLGATGKVRKFLLRQRFLDGELLGRDSSAKQVTV